MSRTQTAHHDAAHSSESFFQNYHKGESMNVEKRNRLFSCMVNDLRTAAAIATEIDGDSVDLSIQGLSNDQIDRLALAFYDVSISVGAILANAERQPATVTKARPAKATSKAPALQ